ncbi:hypothetical protein [Sphingobacterium sp. HSC-15S19]|uniref:hypothetical protein n=1 Tax=Sphingobacterium sp. HSC-15S19 TaxID=2910971 RepID=UPI003D20F572
MTDEVKSLVYNWLIAGADPRIGLRLFCDHCSPKQSVKQLVEQNPGKHIQIIKTTLCRIAEIDMKSIIRTEPTQLVTTSEKPKRKLRDDYPFLADPTCPPELKIIIGDKITTYHNYCAAYEKLKAAKTDRDHLEAVSYLVDQYLKNRAISAEMDHYKEHGKVLGKHPIFEEYKKIKQYRSLPLKDLVRIKINLENNIYRNQKKIKTDKRTDLRIQRENNIRRQQMELAEIDRLLE